MLTSGWGASPLSLLEGGGRARGAAGTGRDLREVPSLGLPVPRTGGRVMQPNSSSPILIFTTRGRVRHLAAHLATPGGVAWSSCWRAAAACRSSEGGAGIWCGLDSTMMGLLADLLEPFVNRALASSGRWCCS